MGAEHSSRECPVCWTGVRRSWSSLRGSVGPRLGSDLVGHRLDFPQGRGQWKCGWGGRVAPQVRLVREEGRTEAQEVTAWVEGWEIHLRLISVDAGRQRGLPRPGAGGRGVCSVSEPLNWSMYVCLGSLLQLSWGQPGLQVLRSFRILRWGSRVGTWREGG